MKPNTYAVYLAAIQRVVTHIVTHLDAPANLAELAAIECLSPYHFHRIFRGMVGETALEFSRRLRLERSADLLHRTNISVTRIAFTAGYETHEAFTRAFRAAYGESPSAFRRRPGARTPLAARCGVHYANSGTSTLLTSHDAGETRVQIDIETRPALRLATVAHAGPYNQIGDAFARLAEIASHEGLFATPGALMLATYDQDPEGVPADELRSRAGITLAESAPLPAGTEEQRIAAGRYARHTHIGGFEHLGDVWSRFLGEALPSSGHLIADGPAIEIYRSDMRRTPKAELRTDLLVPVR